MQSVVNARLYPRTYDLWNSEIDLLNRMQQVLRGTVAEIPAAPRQKDERRIDVLVGRDVRPRAPREVGGGGAGLRELRSEQAVKGPVAPKAAGIRPRRRPRR